MPERPLRVLITGGGTGGHLFPGLALAEAFQRAVPGCDVRFAGSHYGLESRIVPGLGYRLYKLPVRGLFGVSWRRRLWVAAMLPLALLKALGVILGFRPHLVLGVGGYASGPMLAVAIACRRPSFIQEQNAYPGLTNRLLGRFVRLTFLPVKGPEEMFPRQRQVGSPVRREILALRERPPQPRPEPLIFVLGGSQGARAINHAMAGALPRLAGWGQPLRILHQSGTQDLDWVREAYRNCPVPHEIVPFLDDMADAFARARIVVSRSGASAVNEIVTARRAAILIPIPHTSGDHQLMNARRVAEAGAGIVLEQSAATGEALAGTLLELLGDPSRLDRMELACDRLFPGDAAGEIAAACLQEIGHTSAA